MSAYSSREEQLDLKANGSARSAAWRLQVIECLKAGVERLPAHLEYLADAAAEREIPPISEARVPVRGDDRRTCQIPAVRQVVVDEWLQQQLAHTRTITGRGH